MKRLWGILMLASLGSIALIGCPSSSPTTSGSSTPTPTMTPCGFPAATCTPTATPDVGAIFSVNGSTQYSTTGTGGASLSQPVTITQGQVVVWDTSNSSSHTLAISPVNSTSCAVTHGGGSFPLTFAPSSTGTYLFHCTIHSGCGPGACQNCSGMAATLQVEP